MGLALDQAVEAWVIAQRSLGQVHSHGLKQARLVLVGTIVRAASAGARAADPLMRGQRIK
jgi:hypothetical protein